MNTLNEPLSALAKSRQLDNILLYVTGDKNPPELFSTKMAPDVLPIFSRHLNKLGRQKKMGLFLYSSGGSIEAPWPLMNLLREYCSDLEIIVPFKALSAATLLCLGADRIVMTPSSFLSPIDPQGTYQVGKERKNIQVEDVIGFIDFVKTKIGIAEQNSLAELMKILSAEIPPSVLGSVHRTHSLIRLLAEKMLGLHKVKLEEHQKKVIVENLTQRLFSHNHLISRAEAKNKIGFKKIISIPNKEEEGLVNTIFELVSNELQLNKDFNPQEILGDQVETEFQIVRALIYSQKEETVFLSKFKTIRLPDPNSPFAINHISSLWVDRTEKAYGKVAKQDQKGVKK